MNAVPAICERINQQVEATEQSFQFLSLTLVAAIVACHSCVARYSWFYFGHHEMLHGPLSSITNMIIISFRLENVSNGHARTSNTQYG